MLKLYNTLHRKKEEFKPISGTGVGLYTCGPTVYNYAHIGNLRTYVFEDILRRALEMNTFDTKHVMNITDVGHLTDDADQGEDKMEKGSKREGKTAWEIAEFYAKAFQEDIADLNILEPNIWCKATDHIPEQIALVQTLIDKGHAYETSDGIYFDTTTIDDYGKLANLKAQDLKAGARVAMGEKKNPHDFALWKFNKPEEKRQMEWDAFGHKGFPGWHVECSAMSMKYLGEQFDIHCGGVDHIPVHHTNEIAQSESATGKKPWVKYWLHGEFLLIDEGKMAKSGENFITLRTLKEKGYDPLAYRYFLLQAHYRKQLSFSWEALGAAEQGLKHLRQKVNNIDPKTVGDPKVAHEFEAAVNDDLNIPEALAVLQTGLKERTVTLEMVIAFDKILGLDLRQHEDVTVPPDVQKLLDERQQAREAKDWDAADRLRDEIKKLGFSVEDTDVGQGVKRI
jgi:cysteinyl-tRNA synthetase